MHGRNRVLSTKPKLEDGASGCPRGQDLKCLIQTIRRRFHPNVWENILRRRNQRNWAMMGGLEVEGGCPSVRDARLVDLLPQWKGSLEGPRSTFLPSARPHKAQRAREFAHTRALVASLLFRFKSRGGHTISLEPFPSTSALGQG